MVQNEVKDSGKIAEIPLLLTQRRAPDWEAFRAIAVSKCVSFENHLNTGQISAPDVPPPRTMADIAKSPPGSGNAVRGAARCGHRHLGWVWGWGFPLMRASGSAPGGALRWVKSSVFDAIFDLILHHLPDRQSRNGQKPPCSSHRKQNVYRISDVQLQ